MMPDDLSKTRPHDGKRISDQEHELRDWSDSLGVTPERLKEIKEEEGDSAEKVRDRIKKDRD